MDPTFYQSVPKYSHHLAGIWCGVNLMVEFGWEMPSWNKVIGCGNGMCYLNVTLGGIFECGGTYALQEVQKGVLLRIE